MDIVLRKYTSSRDYDALRTLIKSEGEAWKTYLLPKYRLALEHSITYVAYTHNQLCGYIRALDDTGFYVWVVDLLVTKRYRGNAIGKKLLESIRTAFPDQEVFVMSDADSYYTTLGYHREGSLFKVI